MPALSDPFVETPPTWLIDVKCKPPIWNGSTGGKFTLI